MRRSDCLAKQKPMTYAECHKLIDDIDHKLCNRCWEWHPCNEEYFYKNDKNKMDGYNPYCKEYAKMSAVKWKKDNPERFKEIHRGVKDRRREYESVQNKLRVDRGKAKEWNKKNPDKIKQYAAKHKKHDVSDSEWLDCKKYFNHKCAYCELHVDEHWIRYNGKLKLIDLSKEHVDHIGANDLSNCVPSCRVCNSRKNVYQFDVWYNLSNKNYTEDRYNKIKKWIENDHKSYIRNKSN